MKQSHFQKNNKLQAVILFFNPYFLNRSKSIKFRVNSCIKSLICNLSLFYLKPKRKKFSLLLELLLLLLLSLLFPLKLKLFGLNPLKLLSLH